MWQFTVENQLGLYQNPTFEFKDGINVLIGPNGTGKSFLLDRIQEKSNSSNDYLVISYSNLRDGGHTAMQRFGNQDDLSSLASMIISSEGQRMQHAFGKQFFKKIREVLIAESQKDEKRSILVLSIDSMDSGLDIYYMRELMDLFEKTVVYDLPRQYDFLKNIIVLISTNAYEFVRGREVIDVLTGKTMKFDSYEQYADHIIETKEKIFKRNKRLNDRDKRCKALRRSGK